MEMYTAKEVATIAELIATLVSERKIGIELDLFGNPDPIYGKQVADLLVDAITSLDNFPIKQVVENAMLEAASTNYISIFAGFKQRILIPVVSREVSAHIGRAIYEAAFLEIPESLFPDPKVRRAMFREHPDYLEIVQRDIREGKLLKDEMEHAA